MLKTLRRGWERVDKHQREESEDMREWESTRGTKERGWKSSTEPREVRGVAREAAEGQGRRGWRLE